jgi:hypothetical protein
MRNTPRLVKQTPETPCGGMMNAYIFYSAIETCRTSSLCQWEIDKVHLNGSLKQSFGGKDKAYLTNVDRQVP